MRATGRKGDYFVVEVSLRELTMYIQLDGRLKLRSEHDFDQYTRRTGQSLSRVLSKPSNFEEFLGANGAKNRSVLEYVRIKHRSYAKITGRTTVTKELYPMVFRKSGESFKHLVRCGTFFTKYHISRKI
ncbi:MAG: hypothetical protein LBE95_03205 [Holosporaceae bacterium]|nr:hypothetical protein [Holosporaceae bacterium]